MEKRFRILRIIGTLWKVSSARLFEGRLAELNG
jgi:hypothetical protein